MTLIKKQKDKEPFVPVVPVVPVEPVVKPQGEDVKAMLARIEKKLDDLIKKDEEVHKQIPS